MRQLRSPAACRGERTHLRTGLRRSAEMYEALADVYELLTPEPLLSPEGNVDALAPWLEDLRPGAAVLDCACGIGLLAVGLALAGYKAEASDISPAMVARTRALAAEHGVELPARVC